MNPRLFTVGAVWMAWMTMIYPTGVVGEDFFYPGFKDDQVKLRNQLVHPGKNEAKDTRASSEEACQAAQRIFSKMSFLFRTRAEVLEILGDPATISDYNEPAAKQPVAALVYKFDTGFGGLKYTLRFGALDKERVSAVEVESQN